MPDPLFDFGANSTSPNSNSPFESKPINQGGSLFGSNNQSLEPMRPMRSSGPPTLSQELIDDFKKEAGMEQWEEDALRARAAIPGAQSLEAAEALHKIAFESGPQINTYTDWQNHLEFRKNRNQKLRKNLEARKSKGLLTDSEADMLQRWIDSEEEDTTKRETEYRESLRQAQKKAEEAHILATKEAKPKFWDKNKDDSFQGRAERERGIIEQGVDWVVDAISVPVNTVSSMAYALSNELSMGIDKIELAVRDPEGEGYKAALEDYANREREMSELWERGGGFMGILAEWVPFMDDENSVIDLMSSHFREDVGEAYDQLYTNIDFKTNGVLTDMNEAGDRVDDFTFGIPNALSLSLRAPSLPANLADHMISAQELMTNYEFSANERRVMKRELTKEIAGGLLEAAYDPLNLVGGSASGGAVTKASHLRHLAAVTDNGAEVLAKAKALAMLDGISSKGGRYLDELDDAAELAEILSRGDNSFGNLGKFADDVRDKIIFGGEDLQKVLAGQKTSKVKATVTKGGDLGAIDGAAGAAKGRGRQRIYEVGGELFDSFDDAMEFASAVKHERKGVNGEVVRFADLTRAEHSALQASRNGVLAGENVSKEVKKIRELAAQAFSKFKVGDTAADFSSKVDFFVGTTKNLSQKDAARAAQLFERLQKKELEAMAKLTPEQFLKELAELHGRAAKTTTLGKAEQKMLLKQLEEQMSAARKMNGILNKLGKTQEEAAGAFMKYQDMASMMQAGKSRASNAIAKMEQLVPKIAKLDLQMKARWVANVATSLGEKAAKSKLPNIIRKMIVSQVPPKWWRAEMVAKTLGTSDKVQARRFARDFVEATTRRLSKYKFTAEEIEKTVTRIKKGDAMISPEGFGIPIGADGRALNQRPADGFGLVQVGTHIKEEKEIVKSPLVRHLTDEEKTDVLGVVRDIIERTSKESRESPQAFIAALEDSKQGRAILKKLGPHAELALDISRMWDDGAEFLRLFQERKGLKVSELMDDVVEGWFGRVWSPSMMELILENPAIRAFVKNYQTQTSKRLGRNVGLSQSGQFAEREAKGVFAAELEAVLRKKFSLPKSMEIFSKEPADVINANIRLAEQQFEKLRMVQAFAEASAPMPHSRVQELMGYVREAEKRMLGRFLRKVSRSDKGLDTEDALTRRLLRNQVEDIKNGTLVKAGETDNPKSFVQGQLIERLGPKTKTNFGKMVREGVKQFLSGRTSSNRMTANIRSIVETGLREGKVENWGRFQRAIDAMERKGFNVGEYLKGAKNDGRSLNEVIDEISDSAQSIWSEAVGDMDAETLMDLGVFSDEVRDWLHEPDTMAMILARPLDTPEGRMLNVWAVDRGHKMYNPMTDKMEDLGLSFAVRPYKHDKNFVMKPAMRERGTLDPTRRSVQDRRGFILVESDKGSDPFTVLHEGGHLVDNIGALPEELGNVFAEDYRKFATMLGKAGHRADKMPEAFQTIQEYIVKQIFGKNTKPDAPYLQKSLLGPLNKDSGSTMRQLFTPEQWDTISQMMEAPGIKSFHQQYRVKPNEMFADSFALAMRGVYDPRLPEFSKAMLRMKAQAKSEGTTIWKKLHEPLAAARQTGIDAAKNDRVIDELLELGAVDKAERLKTLQQGVQSAKTRADRARRDELLEAYGAKHTSIEQKELPAKLRFVRRVLQDQGIAPKPGEMRAWDLMKKMGAKQPEDLEEIVRLNAQMIKNEDVALMDEVFEIGKTKSNVSEGIKGLMRIMQKSVLALPSGAIKDTIGSMMWYWIHAKNPTKSALKALKLLVSKGELTKAMRSGARIWADNPVLDPMIASKAIVGRTEIEAGRLIDRASSPLQNLEQAGILGTTTHLAGAPVDVVGAAAGKVGSKLGLGKTRPGKAIANIFQKWKKRGRAVGLTTDMPIHFRKAQDEFWRVALYLDRMESGFRAEQSVQEVFRAFGNMGELTNFEEKYLKQWFFFYTWMRKSLPRGARAFIDHPIKARMVYLATIGDVGRNEDGEWPGWLQQMGGWHIGKDEAGNPAVVNLMPGSWFQPMRDVTQNNILKRYETEGVQGAILGSAQSMLRNAMPLWKVPIESATGIDSFTGLPIADPRGTGQKTADRAPPILAAPWVPDSVKHFFGVRKILDKDTGDLLYYRMDPTKRHFLFKPFPGVEAGLNQVSAATLSDERKTSAQQYGRVLGTPVYSVPQARDDEKSRRLAKNMQTTLFRDVEALEGHPLTMRLGRVFVDETNAVGRELKENMTAYGQQYLQQTLARHNETVRQQESVMAAGEMRKLGRPLTPQEQLKIRRAAQNSILPTKGEQDRIAREGELHYLAQKNPQYKFFIEFAERLRYWAQDPEDREDYTKPREGEAGKGALGSLTRLESLARRQR